MQSCASPIPRLWPCCSEAVPRVSWGLHWLNTSWASMLGIPRWQSCHPNVGLGQWAACTRAYPRQWRAAILKEATARDSPADAHVLARAPSQPPAPDLVASRVAPPHRSNSDARLVWMAVMARWWPLSQCCLSVSMLARTHCARVHVCPGCNAEVSTSGGWWRIGSASTPCMRSAPIVYAPKCAQSVSHTMGAG